MFIAFTAVALVVVGLRLGVRLHRHSMGWDDVLICVSMVTLNIEPRRSVADNASLDSVNHTDLRRERYDTLRLWQTYQCYQSP